MAKNFFNRYVWLIDTIQRHGYITFADISALWQHASLNDDGTPLPERTFFNHREAILDIFGIEIRFDKSLGYYLANDDLRADGIRNWLLTSLAVNNLINESAGMRSRMLFEQIPSGRKHLGTIIHAMKESRMLEMNYRKFSDTEPRTAEVAPYCLKVYKQRWYMVARPDGADRPYIYALDRIECLQQTCRVFRLPAKFDAAEYFADWFGIVRNEDEQAERIVLKVWDRQRHYLRTLPLHPSQQETETHDAWSIFTYRMVPTWDLEHELLQFNDHVEVLAPQSLRERIIEHAGNILQLYSSKN